MSINGYYGVLKKHLIGHKRSTIIYLVSYVLGEQNWGSTQISGHIRKATHCKGIGYLLNAISLPRCSKTLILRKKTPNLKNSKPLLEFCIMHLIKCSLMYNVIFLLLYIHQSRVDYSKGATFLLFHIKLIRSIKILFLSYMINKKLIFNQYDQQKLGFFQLIGYIINFLSLSDTNWKTRSPIGNTQRWRG